MAFIPGRDDDDIESLLASLDNPGADSMTDAGPMALPRMPASAPVDLPPMAPPAPAPAPDVSAQVKAAVANKFGFDPSLDANALKDARQAANKNQLFAGLAQAGDTISRSIAGSNQPGNQAFYENLKENANKPVQDIVQGRKSALEDQALKKQQELTKKQETLLDPKSAVSKISQNVVLNQLKKQKIPFDTTAIQNSSAAELENVSNLLSKGDSLEMRKAIAELNSKSKEGAMSFRDSQLDKRYANNIHKTVVEKLKSDKDLTTRLGQYKNLDNALSIITKADKLTPQQIDEFQQAVRGNLGIKGSSGVGERERTFLNSAGLNGERWMQFLTGNPAEIAKDNKIVTHLKNLAQVEQANIKGQVGSRMKALTSGYESIYDKNPQYRQDLDNVINAVGQQFTPNSAAPAAASSGPQPGSVEEHDGKKYKFKGGDPKKQESWEVI